MKRILIFVCLGIGSLKAQNSLLSNVQLNVLYAGLNNELKVMSCKVASDNVILTSDVGVVKDSAGRFFVQLPYNLSYSIKTTKIRLYDKMAGKTGCMDSFEFRIKRIPQPFVQLGSLSPGGMFRMGEIGLQQRLYAVLYGFPFDGLKYVVVSYRVTLIDEWQEKRFSMEVNSNSTSSFNSLLGALKDNARLEFDNIRCVLVNGASQNADTLLVNPVVYYINFDGTKKHMGDFYGNCKISYYSKTFEYVEHGEIKSYTEEFKCVGKDSLLLNKKLTSFGKLSYYETFNKETGKREMVITRNSDTSYNINYYNDEHLFAVGRSRNFQLELYPVRWYGEKNAIGGRDTLIHFMEEQYLQPFGTWRFFGPDMQLIKEGVLQFNSAGRGSVEWVND